MDHGYGNWASIHALRNPHRTAFIDGASGAVSTWRDFDARSTRLAAALRNDGLREGERVALLTFNCVEMMEIYFAIAKLGAIAVPINYRLSPAEVHHVLSDSGAAYVFHSTAFAPLLDAALAEPTEVRGRMSVRTDAERAAGVAAEYETFLAGGNDARVLVDITHDDVAVIMYTSGTTGRPKGAMLTHGNIQWNAINVQGFGRGLNREDITLCAAPLFHIGALGVHTLPLAYVAGASVLMEAFVPETWLELAERHRITQAFLVPAMWAAVTQSPTFRTRDLTSLRYAVSGGAPCPLKVIEAVQAAGIGLAEGFGMTETAPGTATLQEEDVVSHAGSIGRPVTHVDLRIVDDNDDDVPVGEVGELLVRGPNVFIGYWNRPEETDHALRGGWFHTGDMASVDDEGYFTLVDRKKDMVITGGENVYPVEVEQVMYQHPDIVEVAVIGAPDDKWGETVVAFVVLRENTDLSESDLIVWTRERIAHFKSPRQIHFIPELPRNATGKILKRVLREGLTGSASQVNR